MTTPSRARELGPRLGYGQGYELFTSLSVLHQTEHHGLRASWAAGMCCRVPAPEGKFLEGVVP